MRHKLKQISDHVWILPLEGAKDRPNLGYIKGDKMAIAVDAGHSSSHVKDFYTAIEKAGFELPQLTIITHWHWDHTFGMHAVNGKTMALKETDLMLRQIMKQIEDDPAYGERFLRSDPSIIKEYAGGIPLKVAFADELIEGDMTLDLGGVTACVKQVISPHTEDSVIVYVPEDRILFVGDAQLGEFPSWKMDYDKLHALADTVRSLDVKTIIDGHYMPFTKKEYMRELQ